ncbi:hypothetical protein RRG08_024800 [Elysia crispata]|uniref:Uncharacterized protein n=1 Tax=Elysia crispata TaxID=231223 RepID=A0AAE0YJH3_9GAST|nr:hypothetical protein RRG08_024800 [Elysia crispata]
MNQPRSAWPQLQSAGQRMGLTGLQQPARKGMVEKTRPTDRVTKLTILPATPGLQARHTAASPHPGLALFIKRYHAL